MSGRGRHARSNGFGFYRDMLLLLAGILVVGAVVFGGLTLWAGGSDNDVTPPAASPTPVDDTTSSTSTSTSTTSTVPPSPTTTTVPDTTTSSTEATTTLRPARDPSEVRVVVLNSIGVTGLAGALSAELSELGYEMAPADNYSPELSDTMIFHAEGFSVEALDLADELPDATVAPDPQLAADWGVDVVVVIGRSYQE